MVKMSKVACSMVDLMIFLTALLLLCSSYKVQGGGDGGGSCNPESDIVVSHTKTGRKVESKPEFEVTVTNTCDRPLSQVVVKCFGLSTVTPVDKTVIRPVDDENCILHDGKPLDKDSPVKFTYAWDTPQDFPVVNFSN